MAATDKFQYTFSCNREQLQGPYKIANYTVEIRQVGKKRIVRNEFILFFTSETRGVMICEKINGKTIIDPAITIPVKYSHVNRCWTAESSYRNITNLFTFGSLASGFGLLTELLCTSMKVVFFLGHDGHNSEAKMKISGYCGRKLLNETRFADPEDWGGTYGLASLASPLPLESKESSSSLPLESKESSSSVRLESTAPRVLIEEKS